MRIGLVAAHENAQWLAGDEPIFAVEPVTTTSCRVAAGLSTGALRVYASSITMMRALLSLSCASS
jgi:hypothetical protein